MGGLVQNEVSVCLLMYFAAHFSFSSFGCVAGNKQTSRMVHHAAMCTEKMCEYLEPGVDVLLCVINHRL